MKLKGKTAKNNTVYGVTKLTHPEFGYVGFLETKRGVFKVYWDTTGSSRDKDPRCQDHLILDSLKEDN